MRSGKGGACIRRPHRNFQTGPQNSTTSHTVIETTETITSATTTPQQWPLHESPTVAGTRELFSFYFAGIYGESIDTASGRTKSANSGFPCSYNTTSNLTRVVKTPGGSLRLLHIKKRGTAPKCGDCGIKLPGVSDLRVLSCMWRNGGIWGDNRSDRTSDPKRYGSCDQRQRKASLCFRAAFTVHQHHLDPSMHYPSPGTGLK